MDVTYKPGNRYLRISGIVRADGALFLRPSYLTTNSRDSVNVEDSPLQVELHGESLLLQWGALLGFSSAWRPNAPHAAQWLKAKVPFPVDTQRLVFRLRGNIVREMTVPANPPHFEGDIIVNREGGRYEFEWRARHPENLPLFYHVRASADGGVSWYRLGSRLTIPQLRVDRARMAGEQQCLVEVVAYDGVNTVAARVGVPDAPPARLLVELVSPRHEHEFAAPVLLRAFAHIAGSHRRQDEFDFVWTANRKRIADGSSALWHPPSAGEYEISVHARKGALVGQAIASITTV